MSRSTGSRVLVAIGGLFLALGVVAAYVGDTFVDSDEFGDRAVEAFATPEVSEALTEQVVDQLIEVEPELLAVRPIVADVLDGLIRSDLVTDAFRAASVDLHRTVFGDSSDTASFHIADLILQAKTQLTVIDPELGALIPDELTDAIVALRAEPLVVDGLQLAHDLNVLAMLLSAGSLAAFIAAVWLSRSPSRTVVHIGGTIVAAAAVVLVVERLMLAVVSGRADDADLVAAVWEAFVGPLHPWLLALAALGVLVASAAWFGIGDMNTRPVLDRISVLLSPPTSNFARIVRGLVVALFGVMLIREPSAVVQVIVALGGAALVGLGLREVALTVLPRLAVGADADEALAVEGEAGESQSGRRLVRWTFTGILLVGGLATAVAIARSDGDENEALRESGCNGSERACDRRLDEVVLATTHNSSAAARDGYSLGYQTVGIVPQLEDGVRGFLIDVYFGRHVEDNLVITDRAPLDEAGREELVEQVGESAVRSAESIAATADSEGVERQLFLCHAFCELGATDFVEELERIKGFLDDQSREVIVMIVQDEGPRPDDVAAAFEQSGLGDLVIALEPGSPMPTLGSMVDDGTRVVVAAENISGEFDWYHDAFTLTQDTAFKYESIDDFECELNRGEPDSPLLLVNHWLSPVSPTSADTANQADVFTARVEECREVRGWVPNLIAVDFHDRGDLIEIVQELNDE